MIHEGARLRDFNGGLLVAADEERVLHGAPMMGPKHGTFGLLSKEMLLFHTISSFPSLEELGSIVKQCAYMVISILILP